MYEGRLRVTNKLWLISDTHFGHRNIIKFQQRPESHEVIMLSEWIDLVGDQDQILHLGDVFMGPSGNQKRWASVISRLPGEKFLIKGNHDEAAQKVYRDAGFEVVKPFVWKGIAFTHYPVTELHPAPPGDDYQVNIHGHTHGNAFRPIDGHLIGDVKYINLSVEVHNLKPVRLGNVAPL